MPTPIQTSRLALCNSLIRNGAQVVRDGADHSAKASRAISNGKVVVYYVVLMDYSPETDTFNNRHINPIPASQVDPVATFDAIRSAVNVVAGLDIV